MHGAGQNTTNRGETSLDLHQDIRKLINITGVACECFDLGAAFGEIFEKLFSFWSLGTRARYKD